MKRKSAIIILCLLALSAAGQEGKEQEAKQLAQMAQDLAASKKFDQAADAMKKAVELAPRNHLYQAMVSDFALKAGNYAEGIEHALKAIELNDKVGAYYVLAAANYRGDQELDKAREYCDMVLKRGSSEFGSQAVRDASMLQDMVSKKTFTLQYNLDPKKGRFVGGTLAVALPKGDLPYQKVSYEVTGVQSHRLVKGDTNDVLHVVPKGTTPFPLTVKVTVLPVSLKSELRKADGKTLPAEARAFLGPCYSIDPRSPALKKVVADLKGKSNVETARNILKWMKQNIEYRLDKTNIEVLDFKMVDDILERRHAECRGFAMLFVALCRAADIPARPVWGLIKVYPGQDQRFGNIASHNWAELYAPGVGWVAADPQKPETLGCMPTSCLRIFMDVKKSKNSAELLPMFNLLSMNGDKLKFEESR